MTFFLLWGDVSQREQSFGNGLLKLLPQPVGSGLGHSQTPFVTTERAHQLTDWRFASSKSERGGVGGGGAGFPGQLFWFLKLAQNGNLNLTKERGVLL